MKKSLIIISILIFLSPLFAKDDSIRLTVYNRGVAQIALVRQFTLEKGDNWIIIDDISPKIIPETVFLKPLKGSKNIIIQESDFFDEPIELDALWSREIGKMIKLTVDDSSVWGRLLNFDSKYFYLQTEAGKIRLVDRSDADESHFAELPEGLVSQPTMKFHIRNKGRAQEADFELDYLTAGITWTAYYNVFYGGGKAELSGDFVIDNDLEVGFDGAELSLIAGDPHMADDREKLPRSADMLSAESVKTDGDPLFAYYIYPVTIKVDIPPVGKKRIPLLEAESYPAEERYIMKSGFGLRNLETVIAFTAPETPLPAGKISVYTLDDKEQSRFMGEDRLYDTPPGGEVEIKVGQAFNLQGDRRRVSHLRIDRNQTEDVIRVKLMNGSDRDADIIVRERMYGVWNIDNAAFDGQAVEFEKIDSRRAEFNLTLKKNSTAILEYTVRYEF